LRLAARCLVRAGFADVDPAPVAAWLDEVVDTPLPDLGAGEIALRELAPRRIVREMEFDLRAGGVDNRAVLEAIAAEHPLDLRSASGQWSGYLRGFIDMVFESRGRYYLLDWKSNRLGVDWPAYGGGAVRAAIAGHAYALQYAIYALALHRLLRARLPDYDHERHFGGVYYLFIRGVARGRRDDEGNALGVHAVRPTAGLLARLDRLFGAAS
jgi:exodeoxyribonuclease V beta subunit